MQPDSRKVSSLLINPRSQLRFAVPFALIILIQIISINYLIYQLSTSVSPMAATEQETLSWAVNAIYISTEYGLISSIAVGLFAILVWLLYSHRVFGPMVAFKRMVLDLKEGNYKSRVALRKNDEFFELAESLNELAETLQKRHGSK